MEFINRIFTLRSSYKNNKNILNRYNKTIVFIINKEGYDIGFFDNYYKYQLDNKNYDNRYYFFFNNNNNKLVIKLWKI